MTRWTKPACFAGKHKQPQMSQRAEKSLKHSILPACLVEKSVASTTCCYPMALKQENTIFDEGRIWGLFAELSCLFDICTKEETVTECAPLVLVCLTRGCRQTLLIRIDLWSHSYHKNT